MKIRIGFGLGTRSFTNDHATFDPSVDALEDNGFDSLWLSERLGGECPDPIVGLAYAAGRTKRMKFGMSVLVLPGRPPKMVQLPTPDDLMVAVAHPAMEVETRRARMILGDTIPLSAGVQQWGNAAGMVAALFSGDWDLIARCMRDAVAEPKRAQLVPGFESVKVSAIKAGAVAAGLSGSGPSVLALCRGRTAAERAATAMAEAFRAATGVSSDLVVSRTDAEGARILESA